MPIVSDFTAHFFPLDMRRTTTPGFGDYDDFQVRNIVVHFHQNA